MERGEPQTAVGPDETVTDPDTRCIRCGYALMGLSLSGDCPECGAPVLQSISEDLIVHADPRWRAGLMLGLTLLGAGPLTALIASLTAIGTMITAAIPTGSNRWLGDAAELLWFVVLGGLAAAAVGGFLATAPEPRDADRARADDPRVIARWGLPVAIGLMIASAAVSSIGGLGGLPAMAVVNGVVLAAAIALAGGALAALNVRFGEIARRIPDPRLADRCDRGGRWYRRATTFLVILLLAEAVRDGITAFTGLGSMGGVLDLLIGLGGCMAVVLVIIALVRTIGIFDLAFSVRRAIRDVIERAEADAAVAAVATIAAAERPTPRDPAP